MIHGALYIDRIWHPAKQPSHRQDEWVQRGEVISIWEANPHVPNEQNWVQWHIDNLTVLRFRIEDATLEEVSWIAAAWEVPYTNHAFGGFVVARRLWRFDIDKLIAEEKSRLGRPLNTKTDILTITAPRREEWLKRTADRGRLFNKAAGDIALHDPARAQGYTRLV